MRQSSNLNSRLTEAYRHMMKRVKAHLDELEQAEKEFLPNLQQSIEHAAERSVELGELTREEAQLIGNYLKRDIEDAGHYLAKTGHDLREWLRFDLELIEERLLDLFSSAADKTRLQMLAFKKNLEQASRYQTGEITGPGTLQCDNCGERLAFYTVAPIPACPNCAGTTFNRVSSRQDVDNKR
jgi:hypothetical protein